MGIVEDIQAKLDTTSAEINLIAGDITSLKDQLAAAMANNAGAISAADAQALLAKATALADAATALDNQTP